MTLTTVFQTNRTQAVRLAKDVAFPPTVKNVVVLRDGVRRIIVPADSVWDDFCASSGVDMPAPAWSARARASAAMTR